MNCKASAMSCAISKDCLLRGVQELTEIPVSLLPLSQESPAHSSACPSSLFSCSCWLCRTHWSSLPLEPSCKWPSLLVLPASGRVILSMPYLLSKSTAFHLPLSTLPHCSPCLLLSSSPVGLFNSILAAVFIKDMTLNRTIQLYPKQFPGMV